MKREVLNSRLQCLLKSIETKVDETFALKTFFSDISSFHVTPNFCANSSYFFYSGFSSCGNSFIAFAASKDFVGSRHKMEAHPSGEITE